MSDVFWLTNVKLEESYVYENEKVTGTNTGIYHVLIDNGKVAKILPESETIVSDERKVDAGKLLMLPGLRDMHIHIDKTFYGGPWRACTPFESVFKRIEEEKKLLPELLPTAEERSKKILNLLSSHGVTHLRTHCNVDRVVGLKNLETTLRALESFSDKMSGEIVAFPQHGLLRDGSVQLVREALREGAQLVGGVDPAIIDLDIEKSLQTIMDLAVEADKDIDIHLHDPGHLGLFTIQRLAEITRDAGWNGRVTVSHAFGLGEVSEQETAELAHQLEELDISITSVVSPKAGGSLIPISILRDKGVNVSLGTDTVMDHWSPFGNGDTIAKLSGAAEYFRWIDEYSLGQSLGLITGGITPINKEGKRVWPNMGESANFVFVDASSSAEVIARRLNREAVMYNGKIISGELTVKAEETTVQ